MTRKTGWFFPALNGGEESGLNDSGIEAFKASGSLGRETCQNILDHADDSGAPRIAEFEYLDLPASEFPGLMQFSQVFESARKHMLNVLHNGTGNEDRFFDRGLELLRGASIPTLRIGDLKTTGLVGEDDERTKPFWRLLRGQGYSSMQGVGGGTYGIGQRAPFAHSELRTVLYSTLLPTGGRAFVAKAILASHPDPVTGQMTQSKGWWCMPPVNGVPWAAARTDDLIPGRFRRTEVGTDLYVTGFRKSDWLRKIRSSVLQNFFVAIHQKQLIVRFFENGDLRQEIDASNLEASLLRAAEEDRQACTKAEYRKGLGSTIYYLKALKSPLDGEPVKKTISGLGEVKLFVHRDPEDPAVPERYACMRQPMMVVEQRGSSLLSRFAAVLVCDSGEGNDLLAQMEDPKHQSWHEENARNWPEDKTRRGRRARLDLFRFVAETLRDLRGQRGVQAREIPRLGEFLPLNADTYEDGRMPSRVPTGGHAPEESGHRVNTPAEQDALPGTRGRNPAVSVRVRGATGGSGTGGARAGRRLKKVRRTRRRRSNGTEGGKTASVLTANEVQFRSFKSSDGYEMVLSTDTEVSGDLQVRAAGEDHAYPIDLVSAEDRSSGAVLTTSGNTIKGLKLVPGRPLRLAVKVNESMPLVLEVGD